MIPRGPENFGYVTTVPPRPSHYQDDFLIGNWIHHGSRINHAQRQPQIREAVTPRADSLHSSAGLPAGLPAFLSNPPEDLRCANRRPYPRREGASFGYSRAGAIAARFQQTTWFVGRRKIIWRLESRLLAINRLTLTKLQAPYLSSDEFQRAGALIGLAGRLAHDQFSRDSYFPPAGLF